MVKAALEILYKQKIEQFTSNFSLLLQINILKIICEEWGIKDVLKLRNEFFTRSKRRFHPLLIDISVNMVDLTSVCEESPEGYTLRKELELRDLLETGINQLLNTAPWDEKLGRDITREEFNELCDANDERKILFESIEGWLATNLKNPEVDLLAKEIWKQLNSVRIALAYVQYLETKNPSKESEGNEPTRLTNHDKLDEEAFGEATEDIHSLEKEMSPQLRKKLKILYEDPEKYSIFFQSPSTN